MSAFIVYGIPGSPYLRSVLAGLEEKALPYRLVALAPGQHKSPEHLERHPFGRVPVIDHGDFRLYETQAILRYLDAIRPEPAFVPADPRQTARMNQIAGIVDWYFFPQVSATIGFERIVKPVLMGAEADEAIVAAAVPKARICLAGLARLKGENAYLAGDAVSIADLMLAPQLDFVSRTPEGEALLEGSSLADWLARMLARPSLQATTWERVAKAA